VSLVSAPLWPWTREEREATSREFPLVATITPVQVGVGGIMGRLRRELDPSALNTHGFETSGEDRATLARLIDAHDMVWVHTIRTANALGIERWPRSALDIDDLPSQYHASEGAGGGRWIARRRARQWRRRERRLLDRFDRLLVCSEADRDRLGNGPRVRVAPNGFARCAVADRPPATPPRLGFIGTLEYAPNRAGVRWFIEEVWPLVRGSAPDATLRIVGKKPDSFGVAGAGVAWLGYVGDAAEEIASWTAMVVPVRAGGGTRVKIAEAFSRRCPVVSTPLGAFGYDVQDGRELLLASTADQMARACVRLIENPALGEELTTRAHALFERRYTWDATARVVADVVAELTGAEAHPDAHENLAAGAPCSI